MMASSSSSSSSSPPALNFRAHESWLHDALARTCGAERTAIDVPAHLARASNDVVACETTVWTSRRLRRARFTYVDGGDAAQILNCVAYPSPSTPDAPMFGVDLISIGRGAARKTVIGVDLHPTCRDASYANAYVPELVALRDGRFAGATNELLNTTTPSAKFYADAAFFSKGMFFARPPNGFGVDRDADVARASLDVVRAYFDAWIRRLDEAEREAEAMHGACKFGLALEDVRRCVLTESAARAGQDAHDAWQLERDPAIGMFRAWYGDAWSREFAETVLFPGATRRSSGAP